MLQQWLLSLLTIIVGALIGGYLTHFLSSRRDIAVKRREVILPNLMLAIEELEQANTNNKAGSDLKKLEKVVSRIQLVGDDGLINISHRIVSDITERGTANTTELYFALRDRIREELKLSKLQKKYMALAITFPQDKGQDK